MDPLGLVVDRKSRDGPCSLVGRQVEALETEQRPRSSPVWLQPQHLKKPMPDHLAGAPEKSAHMFFSLPQWPVEKASHMSLH